MKSINEQVNDSVLRVFSSFKSRLKQEYKKKALSISPMHFRSLQIIHRNPESNSQSIADVLSRDKSQVARLIGELVNQGYVDSQPDVKDKRNRKLTLTSSGEGVTKDLQQIERSVIKHMVKGISRQDLELYVEVSKKMQANVKTYSASR